MYNVQNPHRNVFLNTLLSTTTNRLLQRFSFDFNCWLPATNCVYFRIIVVRFFRVSRSARHSRRFHDSKRCWLFRLINLKSGKKIQNWSMSVDNFEISHFLCSVFRSPIEIQSGPFQSVFLLFQKRDSTTKTNST